MAARPPLAESARSKFEMCVKSPGCRPPCLLRVPDISHAARARVRRRRRGPPPVSQSRPDTAAAPVTR